MTGNSMGSIERYYNKLFFCHMPDYYNSEDNRGASEAESGV